MAIESRNPADESLNETFDPVSDGALEEALAAADAATRTLAEMGIRRRLDTLKNAAEAFESRADELGRMMAREMGKPLAQGRAEAEKCAWALRYYVEHGEAFVADEPVEIDDGRAFVAHLPIGPVLAVMPWNFPFWQVVRFVAPAMTVGNPGLLKHASNVPRCAVTLEEIFTEAGFPRGAFANLLMSSDRVEAVLRDDRIRGATVTGSEPAGRAVAKTCGEMIKPTVLELGGSDAYLVRPSADLDAAVDACVKGRIQNNGQSCIAAKRFLVDREVYGEFRDRMTAKFEALNVADPIEDDCDIGPLSSEDGRDDLCQQVEDTIAAGATRVCGAQKVEGPHGGKGWWFEPGILERIPEGSPGACEEFFGPVALLFEVDGLDASIELANATSFGLGSAIFTTDEAEVDTAVRRLEAGSTAVNRIVASNPHLPFGGVKNSGYGRELAKDGMLAFTNRKTVTLTGL